MNNRPRHTIFMNEWEIRDACDRCRRHPVLSKATQFLRQHMDEVNSHSDGWHSWHCPVQAAQQLIQLIQAPETATAAALQKALSPIKAFYAQRGNRLGMVIPQLPQPQLPLI